MDTECSNGAWSGFRGVNKTIWDDGQKIKALSRSAPVASQSCGFCWHLALLFFSICLKPKSKELIIKTFDWCACAHVCLCVLSRVCVMLKEKTKKILQCCSPSFPTILKMLVAAEHSCEATHWDGLWNFLLWASTSVEKITAFPLINPDLLLTHHYCLFHSGRKHPSLTCTTKIGFHQTKLKCSLALIFSTALPLSLFTFLSHPSHIMLACQHEFPNELSSFMP